MYAGVPAMRPARVPAVGRDSAPDHHAHASLAGGSARCPSPTASTRTRPQGAANALPGQLPDEVREERRARFMELQQQISAQRLQRKVGTVQRVLIDEVGPKVATGRTAADAPEIDGMVKVTTARRKLSAGDFVDVRITGAAEHDLRGTLT